MLAVIWKEFKQYRTSLIAYSIGALVFTIVYVGLYTSLRDSAHVINQVVQSIPKSVQDTFGIDTHYLDTVDRYLAVESFSLVWPLLAIFLMLSRAGRAIAGEIEQGTMGALLSLPISRANLYLSKFFAGLLTLAVFIVFSVFSAIPIAAAYHLTYNAQNYLSLSVMAFLFGAAILAFAQMTSAMFSERGAVYFLNGGLLVLMYVLNIVSGVRPSLNKLRYATVFHYFNGPAVLVHNQFDRTSLVVFGATIIVSTIIGLVWFSRRDVAV